LILTSRFSKEQGIDVEPYQVDENILLGEKSTGINIFYYWQPGHGV
jgi:predicted transcriptional regulator of viral defense system